MELQNLIKEIDRAIEGGLDWLTFNGSHVFRAIRTVLEAFYSWIEWSLLAPHFLVVVIVVGVVGWKTVGWRFGIAAAVGIAFCALMGLWEETMQTLALVIAGTLLAPPRPRLLWNASASAPVGLYAVGGGAAPVRGDMVIARVPGEFRMFAARRRYLPANVPLVKRVAAMAGDEVCAAGARVTVNGRLVARRLDRDGAGRPMPWWSGCAELRIGEYFLLMTDSPASFDGRYFGVSEAGDIVGKARLTWRR